MVRAGPSAYDAAGTGKAIDMRGTLRRILCGLVFGALACGGVAAAADLRILVPLYAYPAWWDAAHYVWDDVAAAGSRVPITAIINPDNGPAGAPPNRDFVIGMTALRQAGVTMIGYVYTSYGARTLAAVKADIDLYSSSYGVQGIFLDEVSTSSGQLAYYAELYAYIKAKPNLPIVITNPGTRTPETHVARPVTDTTVIFEDGTGWAGYVPDAYVARYPASRFAVLLHDIATPAAMRASVDLAVRRNVGYVYATNDGLPDPWDSLPSYWTDLVACVSAYRTAAGSPGQLAFTAGSFAADESAGTVTAFVGRVGGSTGAASVFYSTADGTALAGQDYVAGGGALAWADGDSSAKPVVVRLVDDVLSEGAETVGLHLFTPVGAVLGAQKSATVAIAANDAAVTDLVIHDLTPSPSAPAMGQSFSAYVTVRNNGSAAADGGYVDVWAHRTGALAAGERGNRNAAVGTVGAGQSKVVPVTGLVAPSTPGACTLRALVDSLNQLTETNEVNNEAARAYTTTELRPDFAIGAIAASYTRGTILLTVDVRNLGAVAGDAGVAQILPDAATNPALVQYLWIGPVPAGQTVRRTWAMPGVLAAGMHFVWGKADCYGLTAEQDENNNASAAVFYSR